ncbi:MAG: sulfur reduction protein DsrE [Anaerolineales bacterium]|nr:sulfur reduction protein DsrE [Anaerolineales bacterium]
MSNKFCVSIANCHQDPDKATVGFVVANAAIGSEKETMVFLSTDGVWAAVKGEAEKISIGEPFAPLKDLMDKFVKAGGRILVCTPCTKLRGIKEDQLMEGASLAGGAALVEFLSDGAGCVSY